jgi:Rrf2 family protein
MKKTNSSMQLTRAADYAVRVMIHLATLPAREREFLPALAEATDAPESFLSKVLQALSRARLITSQRGQSGGFAILPRGRKASMREVIEAIDGPVRLNVCLISARACGRSKWCPAHTVWVDAQRAMLDVLSGAVIADLASQATRTVAGSAGLTKVGVDDRLAALGRLSRDAVEAGLYERSVFPEGGVDE